MKRERNEGHQTPNIRSLETTDLPSMVSIAQSNFDSKPYTLYAPSAVDAYKRANSLEELTETLSKPGTEAYVSEGSAGIEAYLVLRPKGLPGGTFVDIRRMQIAPHAQGKGLAGRILTFAEERAREMGASRISIHAGGSSRTYFEKNGWSGNTVLVDFKPFPALTFLCSKDLDDSHDMSAAREVASVVWAGTNQRKLNLLRQLIPDDMTIIATPAEEEKGLDVIEVARSKLVSAKDNTDNYTDRTAFMSTDVLNHILAFDEPSSSYALKPRSKPASTTEGAENFAQMLRYAEESGRPTPYVLKCGTVIEIGEVQFSSTADVSIWLSSSLLKSLSTPQGFEVYRQEVLARYGRDVMDNSAGFAFPFFLDNGGVMGINGTPIDQIRNLQDLSKSIIRIAHGTPDEKLIGTFLKF